MTWGTVAAIVLTAIVALVSSRITTWLNARRVVWARSACLATWLNMPGLISSLETDQQCPQAHLTITNAGDGDAYGVHVFGFGCHVEPRWRIESPGVLPEGVGASQIGDYKTFVASRDSLDMRIRTDAGAWDDAWLVFAWRQPPMLASGPRGVRIQAFRLRDMAGPQPEYTFAADPAASGGLGEIPESHDVPEGYGVLNYYSQPLLRGLPGVRRWSRLPWSKTWRLGHRMRRLASSHGVDDALRLAP